MSVHFWAFASLAALALAQQPLVAVPVAKFGIVTDVHYANAPSSKTRMYRDSLPKLKDALQDIWAQGADFLVELGDFKDTDASQHCADAVEPSEHCVNITLGFLQAIENAAVLGFNASRYHVLGNHDVDILEQEPVLVKEKNTNDTAHPLVSGDGSHGYYSFNFPPPAPTSGSDTDGCLVTDDHYVWILHSDGSRNWLSGGCSTAEALRIASTAIDSFPKRHGGKGAYNLNASASGVACRAGACKAGTLPTPPAPPPLRFVVLNADYTDEDLPWADLDGPTAPSQGMSWDHANLPTRQLTWLAEELRQAAAAAQRVVIFVHYRLDGGAGGPVGTPLPVPGNNRAWIDDCTLQNAAVVRAVLEERPGLVLATFSGHDHVPLPPYTHAARGKPLYFTHAGMVEGSYDKGNNAYSVVSIMSDCSVIIRGWGAVPNVTVSGPEGCYLNTSDALFV